MGMGDAVLSCKWLTDGGGGRLCLVDGVMSGQSECKDLRVMEGDNSGDVGRVIVYEWQMGVRERWNL